MTYNSLNQSVTYSLNQKEIHTIFVIKTPLDFLYEKYTITNYSFTLNLFYIFLSFFNQFSLFTFFFSLEPNININSSKLGVGCC